MLTCWMFFAWLQTCCIFTKGVDIGSSVQVSEKELQLLASENDPKCFMRTHYDFTCFWEELNRTGQSYHFIYDPGNGDGKTQCALTQRTTANGTILQICSFPQSHVLLFLPIDIWVVDVVTNVTVFQRNVYPYENQLPCPPKTISIQRTEEPGQLQVRWEAGMSDHVEIRYSSQTQPERKKVMKSSYTDNFVLTSLAPGEVCSVQMRVKLEGEGFWSDWSEPATAMVPQKAEATELLCHTADLQRIQCQWNKQAQMNEHAYNKEVSVFYREKVSGWGDWKMCAKDHISALSCSFDGEQSGAIQVNLQVGSGPLDRTFYTEALTMQNRIKTEPPRALRGEPQGERLLLQWDAPAEIFAQDLIYEIRCRSKDEKAWKHFTWQSPKTSTYLNEQAGSQYFIQIKAKPDGPFYKGYWSDWSNTLTVDLPSNNGLLFIVCIPLAILLVLAVAASVFSQYFSKVKQYLWPPVPKLDKMLESFRTEGPQWTFNIKQCDDTPASVVEILSEIPAGSDGIQGTSACTSAPEGGFYSWVTQKEDGPAVDGCLEAGRDYVTLNTEVIPCLRGNEYVYGDIPVSCSCALEMQCHCTDTETHTSTVPGLAATSILNHSYQLLPQRADNWKSENITARYSNLDSAPGTA
ncbi:thrombopoietin receptor isoform X2 [Clupea harengus]|uniref:Thrombopoietin receptor isoform X2 n=1 Tax=Clupea harengus TaxID=7950 RepID=A0A6P8G6P3_CLUHA|nr:thrombopoietin receptor isoform X2 [Clupea harengus]